MEASLIERMLEARKNLRCICGFDAGGKITLLPNHKRNCKIWIKMVSDNAVILQDYIKQHKLRYKAIAALGLNPKKIAHSVYVRESTAHTQKSPLISSKQDNGTLQQCAEALRDELVDMAGDLDQIIPALKALSVLDRALGKIDDMKAKLLDITRERDQLQLKLVTRNLAQCGEGSLVSRS